MTSCDISTLCISAFFFLLCKKIKKIRVKYFQIVYSVIQSHVDCISESRSLKCRCVSICKVHENELRELRTKNIFLSSCHYSIDTRVKPMWALEKTTDSKAYYVSKSINDGVPLALCMAFL